MDTTEFIALLAAGGITVGLTIGIRFYRNRSKKSSSKQVADADGGASVDQKSIQVFGDYHHHDAPKPDPPSLGDVNMNLSDIVRSKSPAPWQPPNIFKGLDEASKVLKGLKFNDDSTEPTEPDPNDPQLSDEERELLSIWQPRGHFLVLGIEYISKRYVRYTKPGEDHQDFFGETDKMYAGRYIAALTSLHNNGHLDKSGHEYTLSVSGQRLRQSLLDSSD